LKKSGSLRVLNAYKWPVANPFSRKSLFKWSMERK